jgi:PAS domain S-box-containing protein
LAEVENIARLLGHGWHVVLEDAPPGVIIVDANGCIQWANRAFVTLFGYARLEIVGKHVNVLLPEDRTERHAGYIAGWFEHPRPRPMGVDLNIQGRNKSGELMNLDIQLSPIETEGGVLVLAWIRTRLPASGREEARADAR